MVKIVLFALVCISSIAKASSGFYISAASLTNQEDVKRTTGISTTDINYNANTKGINLIPTNVNEWAYKFTFISVDKSELIMQNTFINNQSILRLGVGTDAVITTGPNITSEGSNSDSCRLLCNKYTISPIDYSSQISTVKSMILSENTPNTPNFVISNNGGFELSAGYKIQKEGGIFFIAPQIDYSSFGSNSTSLRTSAIGVVAKLGTTFKNGSFYGFGGYSSLSNSSNISTQRVGGLKYGLGTEFSFNKSMALFVEIFQIDLQDNQQSITYSASEAVRNYIEQNSHPEQVTITNTDNEGYKITMNHLGLNNHIDPDSIKINRQTNIKNITGIKLGVTMYFNNQGNDESSF